MTWEDYRRTIVARHLTSARDELADRYAARTVERFDLRAAVGCGMRQADLYRVVPYKEAFSPALVHEVLDHLGITSGRLIDPFVGSGTSLLVAAERGLTGIGVDVLPFSVFASNTLLRATTSDWRAVRRLAHEVIATPVSHTGSFPDFPVRDWAFGAAALAALSDIDRAVRRLEPAIGTDVLRLALLSSVEEMSQATKDGTSLRKRPHSSGRRGRYGVTRSREDVEATFLSKLDLIEAGARNRVCPPRYSEALLGDAREVHRTVRGRTAFDVAVFSPPYPNRYDYVGNYQLELGFGFVDSAAELRALRKAQLRSHLEAPWPGERSTNEPALDEFLGAFLASKHRGKEANRVVRMVAGYFEDIAQTLASLRRVMRPGAPVALVVGTQVFGGEALPTDLLIASLAEQQGYATKEIWVAREKGMAVQQRRSLGAAVCSRESVLLLAA